MADSRHIDSNENKQLLWGILLDEGVFNGIPSNNVKEVQSIFETTINELKGNTTMSLKEQNMTVIQKLLVDIPIYAKLLKSMGPSLGAGHGPGLGAGLGSRVLPPTPLQPAQLNKSVKMPEPELIYSEDTRREKYTEIENKMKQQQQNMRQMLDLPKPPAVDFADDFQDKPLGDDMDRIIQETIAARERDLELINKAITAGGGGGGGDRDTLPVQVGVIRPVPPVVTDATLNVNPNNAPNNADNTNTNERKKVSFSDVNQEYMPPLQQEQTPSLSQIQEIINEIKQEQANMRLLFENMKSQIENIQNKLSFGL